MNPENITHFLLQTVPGVIILGCISSILVSWIARISRPLWRHFFMMLLQWIANRAMNYFRACAETRALAYRFGKRKDYFGFIGLTAMSLFGCLVSSLLVVSFFLIFSIYFIVKGLAIYSAWPFIIAFLFFLSVYQWFRDVFCLFMIYREHVEPHHEKVKKVLKELGPEKWTDFALAHAKELEDDKDSNKTIQSTPLRGATDG